MPIAGYTNMATNQVQTGALMGAGCAGLLSVIGGMASAMAISPDSNLAPILGFIVAPPAAVLGLFLGAAVGGWRLSAVAASAAGGLLGGLLGGAYLWNLSSAEFSENTGGCVLLALLPAIVFSATGAVVRKGLGGPPS